MNINLGIIDLIAHPTAGFLLPSHSTLRHDTSDSQASQFGDLSPPESPRWRIDCSGGLGSHYLVYPLFMTRVPPLRIDVFIPTSDNLSSDICESLDLGLAFHTRDPERLKHLRIHDYLLQALQAWTDRLPNPGEWYDSQIFGTRIILDDLPKDPATAPIKVAPMHFLEASFHSVASLRDLWGPEVLLPDTVDFRDIHVKQQIQDSISIVEVGGVVYAMKAVTNFIKFMYHELHILLTLSKHPHPNIISRPVKLVTKRSPFGGTQGVVGFLIEYHSAGSIRDVLPKRRIDKTLKLEDQIRWAQQLTSAVSHIFSSRFGLYYPDLRCENILLSQDDNIIMVDFEQRGVWCEFSAPEVNAIEYIRILAKSDKIDEQVRQRCVERLSRLLPGWDSLIMAQQYHEPVEGYNVPWLALNKAEREYAGVYMLGRVLWCFFEGVPAPDKAIIWQSYAQESHISFPEYRLTPQPIRDLIDRCTRGRTEQLNSLVVQKGSKLVAEGYDESNLSPQGHQEAIKKLSMQFWRDQVEKAEMWLDTREKEIEAGSWSNNYYDRPTLSEVERELDMFARSSKH
ncbi:Protein kinase domain protein [Ceratocystis lukuohia]|uniref:Protein kinase domain protein n=1 Tax=Ceratocystis lukuohia TaxID=2019550 RepID=A0ABR4M999_9PEZI